MASICIVVLGDIGRSPRMQYHALSLAEHGHPVDVLGYGPTPPIHQLKQQSQVYFHYLVPYRNLPAFALLNYMIKTIWQAIALLCALVIIRRPSTLLVQNPPAVPTLLVCWLYCRVAHAQLIIDWHNYASTLMALNVRNDEHILVRITRQVEQFVGRRADHNLCVTRAMRDDLATCGITATVLYDRPPSIFTPLNLREKHEILTKLGDTYPQFNAFTSIDQNGDVALKSDRPGLLISSTSWTEDEDFSLLLFALQEYEAKCRNNSEHLPQLVCVITGNGPQKDHYRRQIDAITWHHVHIITPWLASEDYPRLLACADLGVCLHTSTSGLDLPMKVIDMFGCGLPVCALHFQCLDELVVHEMNSYVFHDGAELSLQIQEWFVDFPQHERTKRIEQRFKENLTSFQQIRWRDNWDQNALKLFQP